MAKPYMKINAAFYLKNKPKGQLGVTSENWTFGNEPVAFSHLIYSFVCRAVEFYITGIDIPSDEINAELKKLGEVIGKLEVKG